MNIPIIKFVFDRKHKSSKGIKGNVDMRITYGKVQKFIATGVHILPSQWDAEKECVTNSFDAMTYNEILSKMRTNTLKVINKMMDDGDFDINAVPLMLKQKKVDKTFVQYIHERMNSKQVTEYTRKAYHVFYSRFMEWGGIKLFSQINERNIRLWDEYLHTVTWKEKDRFNQEVVRRYSQASIGSMHKNLKVFINDAMVDGYVKENPYVVKRIKIDKGATRIDKFLTAGEISRIEKARISARNLAEARDLFLIQVYTGLSYVDLMSYDFTKCKEAKDYDVFSGYRSKTGVLFTFVLTPKAKEILGKYRYVLPEIPNQQYNMKLKLVAAAADIDKNISSHDGRRSCGYMLLNAGVPISVVSRILGHSSIRQTEMAYARLLDTTIASEIRKHIK